MRALMLLDSCRAAQVTQALELGAIRNGAKGLTLPWKAAGRAGVTSSTAVQAAKQRVLWSPKIIKIIKIVFPLSSRGTYVTCPLLTGCLV